MTDAAEVIEISDSLALPADPLVSVYMLAYRHEKFIAQAIEGVIAQKCNFPIELIIGEDCSPDRTREIALEYQRHHPNLIRIITSSRNVGAYTNARRCQVATRGAYVAICEGDDYWHHPRKLQMQVELMEANPNIMVCHTDFDRLTRFRRRLNCYQSHPPKWLANGSAYIALLHNWSVRTATSMYRREVFEKFWGTVYDNKTWPFGDVNRLLFASQIGEFGYINVSTATYRKVRGSACNRENDSYTKMMLAVEQCFELFLSLYPVDSSIERSVRSRIKQIIYKAAFYAEQSDLMESSHIWLKKNGIKHSEMVHRIRTMAIDTKIPIRLLRTIKNFIDLRLSSIPP